MFSQERKKEASTIQEHCKRLLYFLDAFLQFCAIKTSQMDFPVFALRELFYLIIHYFPFLRKMFFSSLLRFCKCSKHRALMFEQSKAAMRAVVELFMNDSLLMKVLNARASS